MRRKSAYLEGFLMVEQNHLAGQEWVDIVNEDNEVIAQCSREQMRAERLRHRATYIVVHDGMGKILVQRRTEHKDFLSGMLDATAGGVVQSEETMLDSARREAEEDSEVFWMVPEEITARCDEFTPDSLKALALWMTRNARNEKQSDAVTE